MKYKQYKNGIYGIRYRGCYIVPADDDRCGIETKDRKRLEVTYSSIDEAMWAVTKLTAKESEKKMIDRLYELDVPNLNGLIIQWYQEKNGDRKLKDLIETVRNRKAAGLPK